MTWMMPLNTFRCQHLFVVEATVFLVGVNEAQVELGIWGQGCQGRGGGSQTQRDAVRQASLSPVGLGNAGPTFVHVQAEQPPLGSQAAGGIARESSHLDGPPGAHHPGQPLHEHPLFRSNLHPGHWSQRLGSGNQSLLHLIGTAAMVQNVVVKIRAGQGAGLTVSRAWVTEERSDASPSLAEDPDHPRGRAGGGP